jgi:PAS domain S-box-containing protein
MEQHHKPLRVLLIEDMQADADLLVRHLTRSGLAVDHRRVQTAEAMRHALGEATWDLILCDYTMPRFDAPAALKIYQECGLDIPFIVVSGTIGEEAAVAMMRAGAHDYLLKNNLGRLVPVIERELRETVVRRERRQAGEALRRSEAEYRGLFENAIMAVSQASPDGRLLRVNQAYARMYGYASPAEMIAAVHDVGQLYANPDDRTEVLRILSEKGVMEPREMPVVRRDGTRFVVLASAREVRDANGNLVCYQADHVDITARKRAEEAQARRHHEMAAIHQVVTATTSTLDLQQVLEAFLNNLRTLSGGDRASIMLLDQNADQLVAVAARGADGPRPVGLSLGRGEGAAGRVWESMKPLIIPDVRGSPNYVPPEVPPEDEGRQVASARGYAGFPLVSRGRLIGVASLVTTSRRDFLPEEITFIETLCGAAAVSIDNALAHQEIRRRAEKLTGEIAIHRSHAENVLGSISDGVATIDLDKRIASWNRGAETIMGYSELDVLGMPCHEVFHELGADGKPLGHTKDCAFDAVASTGQPYHPREISSVRRNGQAIAISVSDAPLLDNKGNFQGVVRVFRDFTYERELLDNLQRASRAKSMFLANMSHEIRTPMNAILGFSQILLKDPTLTATHRQHLDVIARSGDHLLSLIDDVLDMSRIDAGRARLAPSSFNLRRMLTDLSSMVRLRAESKGLGFAVTVADGVPAVLLADEKRLRQILINLIGNAIKFTNTGSVQCSVAARRETDVALWLTVDVEDTGPGVPPSETERIFHPFEQTEAGASVEGTGLGLAISREFARLMGGDITLDSKVGRGSRFRLHAPVAVGTSGEATPVALRRRVLGIRPGLGPFHILVADEQSESRLLLVEMLKAVGFGTREAASGEEAVTLATEWSPEAILMDLHKPGTEGLQAIRSLRAMVPRRHIPIIAMSASAFEDDRRQALDAGATDFVRKPIRESELLEKIRAVLDIEYVYFTDLPRQGAAPGGGATDSGRLCLPARTVEQLRQAIDSADYDRIIAILDAMADTTPEAATELRAIAERFDYAGLLDRVEARGAE